MEKLLTIVVPAYNVEKYIKNCLDSFIDLSVLRSLEILIVDDGSTDSTASLAHTYEQKYPYSFKVLSKENEPFATICTAFEAHALGCHIQ